jgi:pantoate--beta-alanine ligase
MDATIGAVTVGLVPVMGPLHEGHLSLIRRSDLENDDTVVALFDPSGDVLEIPDRDIKRAAENGARIFYQPHRETLVPRGFRTRVQVRGLTDKWENESQPGRFDRAATFFTILLNQLQPTRTYVGEKHFQRLVVLQRMHEDLALPGEIVGCLTVRDLDGLPMSTYNASLTPEDRAVAIALPNALFTIQQRVVEGETDVARLLEHGREIIEAQPELALEYLAIVDPETFEAVDTVVTGSRAIVAGKVSRARIIDNVHLDPGAVGLIEA